MTTQSLKWGILLTLACMPLQLFAERFPEPSVEEIALETEQIMDRIDRIWNRIEENRGIIELFTLAAENDWLVPQESVLVGDDEEHKAIVPNKGHALVAQSHAAREWVIRCLFEMPK